MGAFISLAFRVSGRVENLSKLDAAFEAAGLELVERDPVDEGQAISRWLFAIDGERHPVTRRCYDDEREVSTTLDIEEKKFDAIAERIGREELISRFVTLGCALLLSLEVPYVFFEEEAEADVEAETFDGTRLFGIAIVPDNATLLERALAHDDIQRVERIPGAVIIYRRLDPVPHLGQRSPYPTMFVLTRCATPKLGRRNWSTYTVLGFLGQGAASILGGVLASIWDFTPVWRQLDVAVPSVPA